MTKFKLLRYGQTFDQIYKQDIYLADTRKSIKLKKVQYFFKKYVDNVKNLK